MRIDLKGLHWTSAKLADGSEKIYRYAWKNGPRINGEPGTPEFLAAYNAVIADRKAPAEGKLQSLIEGYQKTHEFRKLRPRTSSDYIKQIKIIEQAFGDFPLRALESSKTRGVFKDWRDRLALKSLRQADYAWTVLARILSVAKDRGKIAVNPCERGGRLYDDNRVDSIWTLDDEAAFLTCSDAPAPAVAVGVVDRATSGRPVAPALVSL